METIEIVERLENILLIIKEKRTEYNFRHPLIEVIGELFMADMDVAFSKKVDFLFFNTQKQSLDDYQFWVRENPLDETAHVAFECAVHQCINEVKELAILVQLTHGIAFENVPDFIKVPQDLMVRGGIDSDEEDESDDEHDFKEVLTKPKPEFINRFIHFVTLRLGDFFRYLRNMRSAKEMYEFALIAKPTDGQTHNQLALIALSKGQIFEAIYKLSLAVYAEIPFQASQGNLNFRLKQVLLDDGNEDLDVDKIFLKFIASCLIKDDVDNDNLNELKERLNDSDKDFRRIEKYFIISVAACSGLKSLPGKVKILQLIEEQFIFLITNVHKLEETEARNSLLALLWLFASWFKANNISLSNENSIKWLDKAINNVNRFDSNIKLKIVNLHFAPFKFIDFEEASVASLCGLLKIIHTLSVEKRKLYCETTDEKSTSVRSKNRVSRAVPIMNMV